MAANMDDEAKSARVVGLADTLSTNTPLLVAAAKGVLSAPGIHIYYSFSND